MKNYLFIFLIFFFLLFSFSPTIFELSRANHLVDQNREFILEHNYYWPDFNLYLSKIRQGTEGYLTAVEKYTSEIHQGSLIQEFYVILGLLGRILNLDPNFSYQLGRLILSPLLLLMILMIVKYYFPPQNTQTRFVLARQARDSRNSEGFPYVWQILAFLIVVTSGSFPRFFTDSQGITHIARYMEWWSNIDALQRITFIPHILFGQVVSFFLLYNLSLRRSDPLVGLTSMNKFIIFVLLGNAVGLVFPPSLMTLNGVLILILLISVISSKIKAQRSKTNSKLKVLNSKLGFEFCTLRFALFIILTLPSLLYLFFITKQIPWSALVDFHRNHPMMIPFDQYILGTGPIIFLGFFGAIVSIIKRDKRFQPLILWVIVTFGFASLFSIIKEQSPLRFTQTGVFIPLGILGTYFIQQIWDLFGSSKIKNQSLKPSLKFKALNFKLGFDICTLHSKLFMGKILTIIFISLYLLENLYIMKISLSWQTTFITQRANASIPAVPYPPQTMYPLKAWMDAIRFLRDNTDHNDVVLSEITAGNFIPAYSGNVVYFGQSNTVDYDRKQLEVDKFFKGGMKPDEAKHFLVNGRIKYIFESVQEKEYTAGKNITGFYPFLKEVYDNNLVTIYKFQ